MRRLFRKLIVLLILVTMVAPTAIRVLVFAAASVESNPENATSAVTDVLENNRDQSYYSNTFFLQNKATGRFLSLANDSDILLNPYNGSDEQKWQIVENPNSTVSLINLSQNTPGYGIDCYAVEAVSSSAVELNVRAAASTINPVYQYEQGFFMSTTGGYTTFMNREYFFSYLAADSVLLSTAVLGADTDFAKWSLIPCGNPYVLPGISDGSFSVNKYNTTGPDGLVSKMNCYSYALGMYTDSCTSILDQTYRKLQPGYISNLDIDFEEFSAYAVYNSTTGRYELSADGIECLADTIIGCMNEDLHCFYRDDQQESDRIRPSSLNEKMSGPWKKIALVLATTFPYVDYHFYVEHSDGYWSHKQGLANTQILDSNGLLIQNPQTAGRSYFEGEIDYNYFVGYFKIKMDSVPNYIYDNSDIFRNVDNYGEIPAMACNIGTIYPSYSFSAEVKPGKIEHVSAFETVFADDDLPDSGPATDFSWSGDAEWFEFMVYTSATYHIFSESDDDLFASLYSGDTLIATDNDSGSNDDFLLSVYLTPGVLYRLCVSGYSDGTGYGDYVVCFY